MVMISKHVHFALPLLRNGSSTYVHDLFDLLMKDPFGALATPKGVTGSKG
jgi:hypothetical protein